MIWFQEKNFTMLAFDPRWKPTDEDFFYQSMLLHYVLPIDGMASNINLCYMETLDHTNLSCLAPFFFQPTTLCREKKPSEQLLAFADGGNQTRVAGAASEYAIHYAIASRPNRWRCEEKKSWIRLHFLLPQFHPDSYNRMLSSNWCGGNKIRLI